MQNGYCDYEQELHLFLHNIQMHGEGLQLW